MISISKPAARQTSGLSLALALMLAPMTAAQASDHLDTPSVVADPRADIGDIFAWTSDEGRRLNLVMTIVGHSFAEELTYAFHIDSGPTFGRTRATATIACRVRGGVATCDGVGSKGAGGMRVFGGLRDDPFFNNVKGTREAYDFAAARLRDGVGNDEAGCPAFDRAISAGILDRWRHTSGGPAQNLLAGWTPATLVVSIDTRAVTRGGRFLAVWADTAGPAGRIDRMGRPLTGNALLAPLGPAEAASALKERYNRATPATSDAFVPEIEKTLGLYDAFDGVCGDSLLATPLAGASRYLHLATLLADDRLWIDSAARRCETLFAVELAALTGQAAYRDDCGGRTPTSDAVDVYRSLLVSGVVTGVSDGVDVDDQRHSAEVFPFLAAPAGDR